MLFGNNIFLIFDFDRHKGQPGHVYNIGGDNEISNLVVAKTLLKIFGKQDEEEKWIKFVPDRTFNDLRYTINSSKLHQLGWVEQMSWEEGLAKTVEWYKKNTYRYGDITNALVAHPRMLDKN